MLEENCVINRYLTEVKKSIDSININEVKNISRILHEAGNNKKTIYVIGNGGSAANASHFVVDIIKGASFGYKRRFKIHCLSDNIPTITAYSNDYNYAYIYSEQLKNLAEEGDVLIILSGSGNSKNLIEALNIAKEKSMESIGILGFGGGEAGNLVKHKIIISGNNMERSEDLQLIILHAIRMEIQKYHTC